MKKKIFIWASATKRWEKSKGLRSGLFGAIVQFSEDGEEGGRGGEGEIRFLTTQLS